MQRIFAAVKILPDEGLIQLLHKMKSALSNDKIKWVDTANMHITLKFFGETPEDNVMDIIKALENINKASGIRIFTLQCSGLGIFGSQYNPRVIWLGINDISFLKQLESMVSKAILPLGYESDRQNFVPHLTLGRINFLNDKKYFQYIMDGVRSYSSKPQKISAFHLYESKLRPSGPEYSILSSYSLAES
jgi:RNA 2',3'-cyclic 3'-phosphodiesterase